MKRRVIAIVTMICVVLCLSGCSRILSNVLNNNNNGGNNPVVYENPDSEEPSKPDTDPFGQGGDANKGPYNYNFNAQNPTDWQLAYQQFLENRVASGGFGDVTDTEYYFLAELDDTMGESIPELCLKTGTCEADYMLLIYSYNPVGKSVDVLIDADVIYAGHSSFCIGPNGDLYRYAGHMGYLTVDHLTIQDGKVTEETIFEQNTNEDGGDYKSMTEIFGEETNPCIMAPVSNYAALIWYLNLPVATADPDDLATADDAFGKALSGTTDVYVSGDEFYSGVRGVMKFTELLKAGSLSQYDKTTTYEINMYCFTDANFDGQNEMLLRLLGTNSENPDNPDYEFVLLSYQDGNTYAYVLPYLSTDGGLIVCGYSVYHNWYVETYDYYQGIIFDKEYVLTFTPDTYPKMTRPYVGTEADWFPYDADVEY